MAKNPRKAAAGAAIAATLLAVAHPAVAAESATVEGPAVASRVRTTGAALHMLIHEAIEQSQTFRRLVQTIETSDGIVYVEEGECRHRRRACLVAVTKAGPNRLLWVKVDTRDPDWHVRAGLVGHELRHAVEVLSSPTVTDNATLYLFYDRDGPLETVTFETEAAIQAGDRVRAELRRAVRLSSRP